MVLATRDHLSVVIPTKNSGALLADCLESVAWTDEIIVVDMFSTDATAEICDRYPQCRLIQREDYIFGNVNHGFESARSEWIMRLDSDERITPELAAEIKAFLRAPPAGVNFVELWERVVILGHELHHGFGRKHHRKMIFRRGTARYRVQSEHEDIDTSGGSWQASAGYMHLNYNTVGQYLSKMDYYTDRDVERTELPAKPPSLTAGFSEPLRAFYLYYVKRQGYRDGWVGLVDAGMRAFYQFAFWAKLRERWESHQGGR